MNIFRTDGWVKSSLGPAIPGAQIFVCTQPANIASVPPSPLAAIFSDPNGLVPIQQPIITDGFGHYDFYTTPGVYTAVIGLGGIVQEVLPDQSVGGLGGGGGTSLVLQANGTPTANQLLLNLAGAGNVTVADQGNGTLTITGAGATFKTNGTPNTTQSILNLIQGTGIALASDALGGVTVTSTVSGVSVVQFMTGPGFLTPMTAIALSGVSPTPDQANDVIVTRFGWAYSLTFNTISFAVIGGEANIHFAVGIYSGPNNASPGALLWSSGDLSIADLADTVVISVPTYTLLPGDYYLAMTANTSPGGLQIYGINMADVISGSTTQFNGPPVGCGKAANASTNSPLTLPSTLGTIGIQGGNAYGYPMIYFY